MPSNETPLGFISYPDKGTQPWYDSPGGDDGLVQWLEAVELLGIPTYNSFTDLPDASDTESDGDQRQFVAVVSDKTIYRSDGTDWIAWMGHGTEDRPLGDVHRESLTTDDLNGADISDTQTAERGLETDGNGNLTPVAIVTDGDGTKREIWVIASGASDPAGADPEDIIYEEEA